MKPNVGMVYPVASAVDSYTPGTSISYGTGFVVSEARGATLTWDRSDGEFYGDDVLLDTDNSATGYTLDFEASGLKVGVRSSLLGEEKVGTSDIYRINDQSAPDVGFGFIRVMQIDSSGGTITGYEAWWFYKMKFSINSEETRTKERNIEWRVPTLSGKGTGVQLDSSGKNYFCEHQDFDTLTAAKAYLNGKAGISG